ncbi:hypothetical protein GKC28_11780 [Leisingera sp. ANG59]|nr:hypothetical protein [Leisingera sp. ANG59]
MAVNGVLPWLLSAGTTSFSHSPQRQVAYWLSVILLFTLNEGAARYWPQMRRAFWTCSALNLAAIPFGAIALVTFLPNLPRTIRYLAYLLSS